MYRHDFMNTNQVSETENWRESEVTIASQIRKSYQTVRKGSQLANHQVAWIDDMSMDCSLCLVHYFNYS